MFTLQRLGTGLSADARARLQELFDDLAAEVARIDPTAPTLDVYRRVRVKKLLDSIAEISREALDEIHRITRQGVAEVGAHQARWAASQLSQAVAGAEVAITSSGIGINLAKALIDRDPIRGELMADAFSGMSDRLVTKLRREIQLGMDESRTLDEIVGPVRELLDVTTGEAEAIVRTAVNDIANVAHMETWKANRDVTKKYRFVATLDERTCLQCAELDGKEFDYDDDSAPQPPMHWNDRCVTVPVIDWEGLGVEPPDEGERASADGAVPASRVYEDWLRDQPKDKQAEILGASRADLFRAGKVDLKDLVRTDGGVVRVEDLQ